VIEHSQARIERKYIRESPMLEGTRQKSLGNAFRGWNTDWFGGDEGQKRELAGARACLIVKNRTLGSWTFMIDGQDNEYSGVMWRADTSSTQADGGVEILFVLGRTWEWYGTKQSKREQKAAWMTFTCACYHTTATKTRTE
jgi:hypothetical protein